MSVDLNEETKIGDNKITKHIHDAVFPGIAVLLTEIKYLMEL